MRQRVPQSTVISFLALTLGDERARAAWLEAVRGLGMLAEESYARDHVVTVLSQLSSAPGTVGVAARVAKVRLDSDVPVGDSPRSSGDPATSFRPSDGHSQSSFSPAPRTSFVQRGPEPFVDLVPFLAPSLGDEKTREVLHQYAKAIGVVPSSLTHDEADTLLEAMSQASGLLGVVARFAKARLLLKFPSTR